MDSKNKPCANCNTTEVKTKLCFCESVYICDTKCWKEFCEKNKEFELKCKKEMLKQKMKNMTTQQKSTSGKKRVLSRGKDGKFTKAPKPPTDGPSEENKPTRTPEQTAKDGISSKASKKKNKVKTAIKAYAKLAPDNKISIREIKKRGNAEIWYESPGYNPLLSRLSSDAEETEPMPVVPSDAPTMDDAADNSPPPNIENIREEAIQQERRRISLRQFCAICNETIGSPVNRLKCNELRCSSYSSVHLVCVGLYPRSKSERMIIQNSYFCSAHRPEPVEAPEATPKEQGDIEEIETDGTGESSSNTSRGGPGKQPKSKGKKTNVAKKSSAAAGKRIRKTKASNKKSNDVLLQKPSDSSPIDENINSPSVSFTSPLQTSSPTTTESSVEQFVNLSTASSSWDVNTVWYNEETSAAGSTILGFGQY